MATEKKSRPGVPKIIRILRIPVLLIIAFFLGRNLYRSWGQISTYHWRPDIPLLLLSMFLIAFTGIMVAVGWSLILRAMGKYLLPARAVWIYFISEAGKYLPGKVWTLVGRVYLAGKAGVPKLLGTASLFIMSIIILVSGICAVILTLPAWTTLEIAKRYEFFLLVIPAGLVALHPFIFNRVLNWALRKVERVSFQVRLRYVNILLLVSYWCGLWFLKGLSVYVLIHALKAGPLSAIEWLEVTGIVALASVAGTLSVIVPAGLGVTEGVMVLLLSNFLNIDAGIATALALFYRFWAILSEALCIGLSFLLRWLVEPRPETG